MVQTGTFRHTPQAGQWVYTDITFPTAYKDVPQLSVMQYSVNYATNSADLNFMVMNITKTGFRFGRYNSTTVADYVWSAIGELAH